MIIVTGATGFMGTYLVNGLANEGFDVLATGRSKEGESYYKNKGIPFVNLDITKQEDFENLPQKNIDAVVHLAALLVERAPKNVTPKDFLTVNTLGTINVLEYCRKNKVKKMLYTTSLYEARNVEQPISEEKVAFDYKGDHAAYVISKLTAAEYVKHYSEEYGIQGIVLRSSLIRGLRASSISIKLHKNKWVFKTMGEKFIEKAIKGKPIEIWGNCSKSAKKRDIIYIKDVVDFIIAVLNTQNISGRYSIASGNVLTLEDEIKNIVKIFSPPDSPSKLIYRPDLPGPEWDILFDVKNTRKNIRWFPKYSYEEMLKDIKKDMEKDGTIEAIKKDD